MSAPDTKEVLLQWVKTPEKDRAPLSPKKEEMYLRVVQLCTLVDRHRHTKDAISIHMEFQRVKGNSISQAVAYNDMSIAKYILGEINLIQKRFERYSNANWQKEVMAQAVEIGDLRAFNGGMANLIKLQELDTPDEIPIDYTQWEPVRPIFGYFTHLFTDEDLPEDDEEFLIKMEELRSPAKFKKSLDHVPNIDFEEKDG